MKVFRQNHVSLFSNSGHLKSKSVKQKIDVFTSGHHEYKCEKTKSSCRIFPTPVIVNTTDLETNDAKPEDEDLNLDEPTDPTTMHE